MDSSQYGNDFKNGDIAKNVRSKVIASHAYHNSPGHDAVYLKYKSNRCIQGSKPQQ